jgi:hypothetical protein
VGHGQIWLENVVTLQNVVGSRLTAKHQDIDTRQSRVHAVHATVLHTLHTLHGLHI